MTQQALASPVEVIAGTDDVMSININGGGAADSTLTAGTYGSILTMIYELDDILPANMSAYLNSSYKVVIAHATLNFTLDWTSATLMRRLGFRDDLAGAGTYTATDTIGGVWIPPYYSADTNRFAKRPNVSGGNAVDGTFSGISLAPSTYHRAIRWQAVAAAEVYEEACEAAFLYPDPGGTTYYPEEERCLSAFTLNALTASPTGTEGISIKGAYYIEDLDEYVGAGNLPASMGGGGLRLHLDASPDNYVWCHLKPGRWFDPETTIENLNSLYNVGMDLTTAIGGVPSWSAP